VLSDHGQTHGRRFRQRYGIELEELVRQALADGDVYAPPALDEGLSLVGGAITDARDEATPSGRMLARATRDRVVDGDVVLGPNRVAAERSRAASSDHAAVVLAWWSLAVFALCVWVVYGIAVYEGDGRART